MQREISWENPTEYTDGQTIDAADVANIKVHVFKDSQEVYVTLPGVTTWPIETTPGVTNVWELTAEINGVQSAKSAPYSYTELFPTPMAPVIGSIT